jgi:plasmid stabilization system protein ParE
MSFEVRFAAAAEDDLSQLFEFLLEQAQTTEDMDRAQQAIDAIFGRIAPLGINAL